MSFDARSLERLRQLGRSLPKRLPVPEPPAPAFGPAGVPSSAQLAQRAHHHRLETETEPEALFHALVEASADGSIPAHMLDRLRELEAQRHRREAGGPDSSSKGPDAKSNPSPRNVRGRHELARGRQDGKLVRGHEDLYSAFQQLLLEDDGTQGT